MMAAPPTRSVSLSAQVPALPTTQPRQASGGFLHDRAQASTVLRLLWVRQNLQDADVGLPCVDQRAKARLLPQLRYRGADTWLRDLVAGAVVVHGQLVNVEYDETRWKDVHELLCELGHYGGHRHQ